MIIYHADFGMWDAYIAEETNQGIVISKGYEIMAIGSGGTFFPSVHPGFKRYEVDETQFRELMSMGKESLEFQKRFHEKTVAFMNSIMPVTS